MSETTNLDPTVKVEGATPKATPKRSTPKGAPKGKAKGKGDTPKAKGPRAIPNEEKVFSAIKAAGREGITLKELCDKTGLRYRVVHNLTWRMEGGPVEGELKHPTQRTIKRVNLDRTVRYATMGRDKTPHMRPGRRFATQGFSTG
jgi:hypothetical protein